MNLKELEINIKELNVSGPIVINRTEVVVDVEKFIQSNLNYLKSNKGNMCYMPYFKKLYQFYQTATNENTKCQM